MSDFHQPGVVTALPRLRDRPIEDLEGEIRALTPKFPVALVLPMIPSEMDRPALAGILDELCQVDYLDTLARLAQPRDAGATTSGPCAISPATRGGRSSSGANRRPCAGSRRSSSGLGSTSARRARGAPAGWRWGSCSPRSGRTTSPSSTPMSSTSGARCSRGSCCPRSIRSSTTTSSRPTTPATRTGSTGASPGSTSSPLLSAFRRLIGADPFIRYMASFRYPLSGEFAVQRDLASRMRLPSDWGLEIVSLFEARRHRAPVRMCQVEIAERYDHKHQELSADDAGAGLHRMAREIGTHLMRTLAAAGRRALDRTAQQPARGLPARGRGRGRRQLRGGADQRPRLRPPRGGGRGPDLREGAAHGDLRVPGRPGRSAAGAQLGPRLGRRARRRAPAHGGRGRRAAVRR